MSVTLYWQAMDGQHLPGQSSVKEALERVFGSMPFELDAEAHDMLRGMAATWTGNAPNPYEVLQDAIVDHGRIQVYAEY